MIGGGACTAHAYVSDASTGNMRHVQLATSRFVLFLLAATCMIISSVLVPVVRAESEIIVLRGRQNAERIDISSIPRDEPAGDISQSSHSTKAAGGRRMARVGCKLGIDNKISYDDVNKNIKIDTILKNLCSADATVTKLTMSTCVSCPAGREASRELSECSDPVSVLDDFKKLNGGTDMVVENIEKKVEFAADLTSFGGGPGVACSDQYYTVFDYEAEAVISTSELDALEEDLKKKFEQVEYDISEAENLINEDVATTGLSDGGTGNNNKKRRKKKKKKRRPRLRFCSAMAERSKCRRCQSQVRGKFDNGVCSNDVEAAREGKDCNRVFDKCRVSIFRGKCKRWRDAYGNCFLPVAVSPDPDGGTCTKECNISIKGESTYDGNTKRITTGVALYNNCYSVLSLDKLTYSLCTECTQADGTVEKKCRDARSVLGLLEKVNGGNTVLPPDAQRYIEVESDEIEGNCGVYPKLDYEATAAVQVFHESFEAGVEVDCSDEDDEDATSAASLGVSAGRQTIQPSPALDEAFASYFQAEEDCEYADLDGCGARQVAFSGVDSIQEGPCREVFDTGNGPKGDIDPSVRRAAVKRRKRKVKIKGRNRKNGKCRRKCASRNKKVSDTVRKDYAIDKRYLQTSNKKKKRANRLQCVRDEAKKPNLTRELRDREDEIGFATRRAAILEVREEVCDITSAACNDNSHGCCGTEGCSCGESSFTGENCKTGTRQTDESIKACFLSYSGSLGDKNQCCGAAECSC